jgi:hypothetical protein
MADQLSRTLVVVRLAALRLDGCEQACACNPCHRLALKVKRNNNPVRNGRVVVENVVYIVLDF